MYVHGDIVEVKSAGEGNPYPCVVLRHAYLGKKKQEFLVCLRTNNPAFVRSYEQDISMEFLIGKKKKGFITTSPIFVKEDDVIKKIGVLTKEQQVLFDRMLLKLVGILER